jgi:GNAT superfamily N-acetyltransferase
MCKFAMAKEIIRATRDMMVHVQDIINSNGHLYEGIVDPRDSSEHHVTDAWAERNFKIREFYLLRDLGADSFIGACSFQVLGKFAYVGYLYVRYRFHRLGHGESLITHLERRTIHTGLRDLRLFTNEKASWARKFYAKMGFSVLLSRKADIIGLDGGIMAPFYEEGALFMRKLLDE